MKKSKSNHEDNWKEIMAKRVRRTEILIGIILTFLLFSLFHKVFSSVSLHKNQYDMSLTLREVEKSVLYLLDFKDSVLQTLNSQGIPIIKIKTEQTLAFNTHPSEIKSPKLHTHEELNKHNAPEQKNNLERQDEGGFEHFPSTNPHRSGKNVYESKNNIELLSSRTAPVRNKLENVDKDKVRYRNISSTSRKLEENCNGTLFRLDIEFDRNPWENSWTLYNENSNALVEEATFDSEQQWGKKSFEKCLLPGSYDFIIRDRRANGIDCDNLFGCYNISMDGKLYIRGSRFSREKKHSFDSTSLCLIRSLFPLQIHFNSDSLNNDISLSDIHSKQVFDIKPLTGLDFAYFACLPSGLYDLTISAHTSYQIFMHDEVIFDEKSSIREEDMFSHESRTVRTFTHKFILTHNGHALKNPICHKKPMLIPYNIYNNYTYDERVVEIIDTIRGVTSSVTLNDLESPQYKATCFIIYDDIPKMQPNDSFFIQRYALVTLLYATNQPVESIMQRDTCAYYGLTCATKGSISEIEWSHIGLRGRLPSEISRVQSLEKIDVSGNNLQGTIPPELGFLSKLVSLKLHGNKFTGAIPSQIGNLLMLKTLKLSDNTLSGTIPTEIGRCSILDTLDLFANKLIGSIPSEIFDCTQLSYIDLSVNQLTSTIPTHVGQLDKLSLIDLNSNKLTGPIPSELGDITSLEYLSFASNALDGSLPEEIGNLYLLWNLLLSYNSLTGTISNIFGNLTYLHQLYLMDNDFSGSIPDSIWSIDSLKNVRLHNNKFTGTVPQKICGNSTYETLKLDYSYSAWFNQNESNNNDCNPSNPEKCHLFIVEENKKSRVCPATNKKRIEFFFEYKLTDTVADVTLDENGFSGKQNRYLCLSPTGCHRLELTVNSKFRGEFYYLNYNSSSKSLVRTDQDECDPVNVSGISYGKTNHKRAALDHLTQVAVPEFNSFTHESEDAKYKALSWIMQNDEHFDQCKICDGTLVQRFVLAYFYISQESLVVDFDSFSFKPTCEWDGVTCDGLIVRELEFVSKNLEGTLMSEIGLLAGLRRINFSDNKFTGTISSDIFEGLMNLEYFNISNNTFEGSLPKSFFSHPKLTHLIATNNTIVGLLPDDIEYPKSLVSFDMRNNILQGTIPEALLKCENIEKIDLAQNGLSERIPSSISNVKSLRVLHISGNKLTGSIPSELFELPQLKAVKLNANSLTGNIPENVGVAEMLTHVHIHHNKLKGTIPDGFQNLINLTILNLHENNLIGQAPNLEQTTLKNYTTDCGDPYFHLTEKLECNSCTMCCNSEGKCQDQTPRHWKSLMSIIIILLAPFLLLFFRCITYCKRILDWIVSENFDAPELYRDDSIFCLVFSPDIISIFLYFLTVAIQVMLYYVYLSASFLGGDFNDNGYPIRCIYQGGCINTTEISARGWVLLSVIIVVYLGRDLTLSFIQIQMSLSLKNWILGFSGIIHFLLSGLAIISTFTYNEATAENDTDMITNAVILLFINDIDEQMLKILQTVAPEWTRIKLDDIETSFRQQVCKLRLGLSF